jgi:hypothetical protein
MIYPALTCAVCFPCSFQFWLGVAWYREHNTPKHAKTHQNTPEHTKTHQNTPKHIKNTKVEAELEFTEDFTPKLLRTTTIYLLLQLYLYLNGIPKFFVPFGTNIMSHLLFPSISASRVLEVTSAEQPRVCFSELLTTPTLRHPDLG